jgi:hypothetical protein
MTLSVPPGEECRSALRTRVARSAAKTKALQENKTVMAADRKKFINAI